MFLPYKRDYVFLLMTTAFWLIVAPNAFLIFIFASKIHIYLKVSAVFFIIFIEKMGNRFGIGLIAIVAEARRESFTQQLYIQYLLVKVFNNDYSDRIVPDYDPKISKIISREMEKLKTIATDKFEYIIKNDYVYYFLKSVLGIILFSIRIFICAIAALFLSSIL